MTTARTTDIGLIEWLRDLGRRVARLEGRDASFRRNDIRLRDTVVTADSPYDALKLQNLSSGEVNYVGLPEEIVFSFSGEVIVNNDDTDYSPVYLIDKPGIITSVSMVFRDIDSDSAATIWVIFNGRSYYEMTSEVGALSDVDGVNIPVGPGDTVGIQLISYLSSTPQDLSVFLRFGRPDDGAELTNLKTIPTFL